MQAKSSSVDFNFPSLGGDCPSPITNNGYMKQQSPTHNSSSLLSDIGKVCLKKKMDPRVLIFINCFFFVSIDARCHLRSNTQS